MQLIEQCLQKCHQDRWFGTDSMLEWHTMYPQNDEPLLSHFWYPPATEKEIRETEAILGFALPQDLRLLYQHLANGGFGPDWGLIGVTDGCIVAFLARYPHLEPFPDLYSEKYAEYQRKYGMRIPDIYRIQTKNASLIDFTAYNASVQHQGWVDLPYTVFPKGMCTIGIADGNMGYIIDAITGAIYRCEGKTASMYRLTLLAPTLEQWLQSWLNGTWTSPYTERMAKPFIRAGSESEEEHQQRKEASRQVRKLLYHEPRQFHGSHQTLLERIYQRCLELGGLILPKATEAQVLDTEAQLGRPLPLLLRDLYLQIANGGFGPTYGLLGVENGYRGFEDSTIFASFVQEDGVIRGVAVSDYEEEIRETGGFTVCSGGPLPYAEPLGCIRLSDDGCGLSSWLHLDSQRVFQLDCTPSPMHIRYTLKALSLEEWFETWLAQDLQISQYTFDSMLSNLF